MFKQIYKSFYFAGSGLIYALKSQRNMRIHLTIFLLVLLICRWLKISSVEWAIIIFVAGLVFITELLNTALETTVDLEIQEYNKQAGIVKDLAASAVLVASVVSVIIGIIILGPKVFFKVYGP